MTDLPATLPIRCSVCRVGPGKRCLKRRQRGQHETVVRLDQVHKRRLAAWLRSQATD